MIIFPKYVEGIDFFFSPKFLLKSLNETSWNRSDGFDLFKFIFCVQHRWMITHTPPQINKIPKLNKTGKYTGKVQKKFSMSTSWSSSTIRVKVVVLFMLSFWSLSSKSPHCLSSFVTNRATKNPGVEINLFCMGSYIIIVDLACFTTKYTREVEVGINFVS